jgi:hypothetical protein
VSSISGFGFSKGSDPGPGSLRMFGRRFPLFTPRPVRPHPFRNSAPGFLIHGPSAAPFLSKLCGAFGALLNLFQSLNHMIEFFPLLV